MNYYEIGQRIKARRKALNYTQSQLASIIGLTESSISRYENGKIETMPTTTIKKICEVLLIEPSELLGMNVNTFEYDLREILLLADNLPFDVKSELLHIIKLQIKLLGGAFND